KRLQQVLKNLLSNAFKFTQHGHVTMSVEHVHGGWDPSNESLNGAGDVIAFSVQDTGIGISPDKQQIIFEAFQQADGSTSRKYGGTGLGLAISRELSRLLGGEIRLVSAPRSGSTFTLFLPVTYTPPRSLRKTSIERPNIETAPRQAANIAPAARVVEVPAAPIVDAHPQPAPVVSEPPPKFEEDEGIADDRHAIVPGDQVLLIVENEPGFAELLLDAARHKGFKGIVTSSGVSALALATEYMPSAVTLDIFLPDIDGWRVLDRLKNDDQTRHMPVSVISTDESRERALKAGAFQFVAKPMQSKEVVDGLLDRLVAYLARPRRHCLAVSPDLTRKLLFQQTLAADDVEITAVDGYDDAAAVLASKPVDCIAFDAALAAPPEGMLFGEGNGSGADAPPIVLFGAGKDVNEFDHWGGFARRAGVREARSPEELLEQASFCMHRSLAAMPESHRAALKSLQDANEVLHGKRVMIVDDDMRNIFALTSLLEDRGMIIVSHDNGRDAVTALHAQPDVEAILMDIMMPEMDGIDTIREIRQIPACRDTPIIAVTAKAMKGDREKCMEAGAWDYLSKPVDTELMLGCLRGWLSR
ncbi:MAG TPA: response regulator, partial [Casimicrobiaceae bacterium]|nr:response regulator [Casimicrobiaceae bacterium]